MEPTTAIHAEDAERRRERENREASARAGYGPQEPFPAFKRVLLPGFLRRSTVRVYVTVDWDGKRLSMTGVEGPKADGNAYGGCGQCGVDPDLEPNATDGWNAEMLARLREMWDRWHLNDMKAACAHETGDPSEKLQLRPLAWGETFRARLRKVESGAASAAEYAEFQEW